MSDGKTWVEVTVSPIVVRLPRTTNYYTALSQWFLIHDEAVAAFNALGTGVNLAGCDVVIVGFKDIRMTFGAGVAATPGSKMLLQQTPQPGVIGGAFSPEVMTHEFGHIHGLSDAGIFTHITPLAKGGTAPDEWLDVNVNFSDVPRIKLVSTTLANETCAPTNTAMDPGETVTVNFTLTNAITTASANLTGTLPAGNGVVLPTGPQNYGALVAGGSAATRAFSFTASGPCGGTLTATLQVQDGTNNPGAFSTTFTLGRPGVPLAENFDSVSPPALPAGWSATPSGAGTPWVATGAASSSAPNAALVPNATAVSDHRLTSPAIAITTPTARVTFRHFSNSEPGWDGGILEIAIGGGAFTEMEAAGGTFTANGYNRTLNGTTGNPLGARTAWSGNSGGCITTTANLPAAAAGQSVQLR